MPKLKNAKEALQLEVSEAWSEYLESTKHRDSNFGYEELEMWAWHRLQGRLRAIQQRSKRLNL